MSENPVQRYGRAERIQGAFLSVFWFSAFMAAAAFDQALRFLRKLKQGYCND